MCCHCLDNGHSAFDKNVFFFFFFSHFNTTLWSHTLFIWLLHKNFVVYEYSFLLLFLLVWWCCRCRFASCFCCAMLFFRLANFILRLTQLELLLYNDGYSENVCVRERKIVKRRKRLKKAKNNKKKLLCCMRTYDVRGVFCKANKAKAHSQWQQEHV